LSHRVLLPLLKSIHAGNGIQTHQAAALKSWLVSQNKELWTMTVNNENNRPPYLCGRLFAVLEVMQSTATNATETIASRYFGSASTTPKAIFGLLIKNSQAHLSKIKKNKEKAYLEKFYIERIQNITMNLPDFPTVLDLKEQAEFALGYYQERQDIFSKKGVDKNEL